MIQTDSSPEIQDKKSVGTNTSLVFDLPPVQVEDAEPSFKGIYAVLPAYNEELVIGSVVLRTRQYAERVIVVDDGSSDRTAEIAKLAGADVIKLDQNTGKANALLLGLKHARKSGCTVAVMLDADGQHDPSEIQQVARLVSVGKADLVIGSRFLSKNRDIPAYRVIGQKTLDLFTNIGAKTKVTDSQSGFRALSCQALDNLDFKSDGYNIESDMIANFSEIGLPIMEVPISVNYVVPNKHKKHPISHGVGVLTRLINLIAYRRPMLIFGVPGFIFIIIGILAGYSAITEFSTSAHYSFIMSLASNLFLFLGVLMGISGLLLNTLVMIMKEHSH